MKQPPGQIFPRENWFRVCAGAAAETGGWRVRGSPSEVAHAARARGMLPPTRGLPGLYPHLFLPSLARPCSSGRGHSLVGSHRRLLRPPLCRLPRAGPHRSWRKKTAGPYPPTSHSPRPGARHCLASQRALQQFCHFLGWSILTVRRQGLMLRELDGPCSDHHPSLSY